MPIPKKVLKGKTLVVDCTIQLVDAISRHDIMHSIIPAKILETAQFVQQEVAVTDTVGTQVGPVLSFLILKSQEKFQWSTDAGLNWMTTNFVCVVGSFVNVQVRGLLAVPTNVTLIAS